jgi:hypothetical protein
MVLRTEKGPKQDEVRFHLLSYSCAVVLLGILIPNYNFRYAQYLQKCQLARKKTVITSNALGSKSNTFFMA